MYEVIKNIIDFLPIDSATITPIEEIFVSICACLVVIFSVTMIDLLYRVFRHFWR